MRAPVIVPAQSYGVRGAPAILPTMPAGRKPRIAVVGAGSLGSALAVSLRAAGYIVSEIVSRNEKTSLRRARTLARKVGARTTILNQPEITADVIWFCVPDREITHVARAMSGKMRWMGKTTLHSSGALASDALASLRRRGANIASAHPLMTFVPGVIPSLGGVSFAVEGDALAVRVVKGIVRTLGGRAFPIRKQDKPAYHAWGTFASPLLTSLLAATERVAKAAHISRSEARRRVIPIVRQTVENYARQGAASGFSGPIVRGDTETVSRHLKTLRNVPEAAEVYRALARAALRNLPVKNRGKLARVLSSRRT